MAKNATVSTLALLVFGMLAVQAEPMSPPPKKEPPPAPAREERTAPDQARFTQEETVAIRDYFRAAPPPASPGSPPGKKMKTLPPGLRKKVERGKELPPGWQKKIERGEVIDAQVYAHSRPLPPELRKRLPPPPPGTIVVTVEGKVVRLMEATLTILDVFDLL